MYAASRAASKCTARRCLYTSIVLNASNSPRVVPSILRGISMSRPAHKDPWLLPNTPEHLTYTETPPDLPPPKPLERPHETIETMRARLVYQSRKRGTLESDLLLSTFAKEYLDNMDVQELKEYDKLLDEPDWDIYYWSTGKREPPGRWANSTILDKLKFHAKNEGRVVRRMPPL